MYHRISDTSIEPNWLAVSPKNFAAHVQYLKQTFNPMRLTDLVESIKDGSLPDRSVAITFDDGYSDNLTHALPVLESFAVPATIFVTTTYVDSNREPWWDEMKHFLLAPRCVPAQLSIQVADGDYSWPTVTLEDRLAAHQELENLMRPLPVPVNDAILDHLATWAGSHRKLRPAYRTVTMPQLTQLAEHPLIELGAHTLTHPILPTLTPEDQFNEIVGSRYMLEKMIHQPVLSFAYPNGDFTEETRKLVNAAGFNTACTTINGRVEPGDDVFCLRRCAVNDWDIALFKKNLEAFFHDRS
ncbi:MAG: polysaccharide deacetylase family protein [Chloroflexi bacterium]|nr:polysaccharide deacetylase family protein [Chloroflexota bacterium]